MVRAIKNNIVWLILLSLLWFCSSCSPKITQSEKTEVKDSTVIRYKPREITTFTPEITVKVKKVIECDPRTNKARPMAIEKKKNGAKVKATVDSAGILEVSGGCDSLEQKLTVMDKEIFRLKHEKKQTVQVVTVYKTRKIDVFCRWFTIIVLVGTALYIYIRIRKGLTAGLTGRILGVFKGLFFH